MHSYRLNRPVIAVTIGDPAGIGPEVVLKALNSPFLNREPRFLIIGDGACLKKTARSIKIRKGCVNLIDLKNAAPYKMGTHQGVCGQAAIDYIDCACELIKNRVASGLVTAPVNKESVNKTGIKFSGHTEYLADKAGVKRFAMMFVSDRLKVVLVTRHIALRKVGSSLNKKKIVEAVQLSDKFLKNHFKVKQPRIGVLGLNPHAGEEGLLGDEEMDVIGPALKSLKSKLGHISGPLPPDSAFHDLYNAKYDLLVCMYHDQGMIPIKMLARNNAVNVTVGLPYIRTSPVHGTAFDIAGKGIADPSSMVQAMNLASDLITKQKS